MDRQNKIEFNIKKIIYDELSKLPNNRSLLLADLIGKTQLYFIKSLGDSSDSYKEILNNILEELSNNEYILVKKEPFSVHETISKGLNFDEWSQAMNVNQKNSSINIGSVNAHNIQLGNQNVQINDITIHELVRKVAKSGDQEAKSLLKKLLENSTIGSIVGAGVSTFLNIITET